MNEKGKRVARGMDRRSFLGFGAASALVAGMGLAGCAPKKAGEAQALGSDDAEGIVWNKEADVVVVGYGGAGVSAAIEAANAGSRVIVLEIAETPGGSTTQCGAYLYLGGGTALQRACGIEDTVDTMFAYMKKAIGRSCDDEILRLYCEKSPEAYDWLVANGVSFEEKAMLDGHDSGRPEGYGLLFTGNERAFEYAAVATPVPRGHGAYCEPDKMFGGYSPGPGLFEPLKKAAEAAGVEAICKAEAKRLIQDGTGRVVGVAADIEGAETMIKAAKGVVLTAGAFSMNDEMIADYCPDALLAGGRVGNVNDSGAGIVMGQEAGGAVRGMQYIDAAHFLYQYGEGLMYGIQVDGRGARVASEDWYGSFVGQKVYHSDPAVGFVIADADAAAQVVENYGMTAEVAAEADTIEALAEAVGINPSSLSASVDRYNSLCDAGVDEDFHKEAKYLTGIRVPPFKAFFSGASASTMLTLGGLKVDANMRVLSKKSKPIPALFAAGRNACALQGEYAGSGTSVGEAIVFGRIAGQQAAAGGAS